MYPASCTVIAQSKVRIDINNEEAGPFLFGTTVREAENTIEKGTAHEAANRHIKGVMINTEGMLSIYEKISSVDVAKKEIKEPVKAALISPK